MFLCARNASQDSNSQPSTHQAMRHSGPKPAQYLIKSIWKTLEEAQGDPKDGNEYKKAVSIVWVPGHKGIDGNEAADQAAKEAAAKPESTSDMYDLPLQL